VRYQDVIEQVNRLTEKPDDNTLNCLAWSHYRTGNADEANRTYRRLLSSDPTQIDTQFDLALTFLAGGGSDDTAIVEYERACAAARDRADSRRRYGLVVIAHADFVDGLDCGLVPDTAAAKRVRGLLNDELQAASEQASTASAQQR
jgi:tetratricopeptide (TPR) repeat protein